MEFLSTDHLTTVMLYLHIRQKHILHRNQVLAVRQAVVVAEEEAHPAVVEEVAEATASNRMRTRNQLIFIKRQRNLLRFLCFFLVKQFTIHLYQNVVRN